MIYFDNTATTKICEEALKVYIDASNNFFYNPSAKYEQAVIASNLQYKAKETLKKSLGAGVDGEIVFTGSATEANNLAIFGSVKNDKKQMLFSEGEHPSVRNCAIELEKRGYDVDFIPLQKNGQINYEILSSMLNENVSFVSVMLVSNETGAINDLKKVHSLMQSKCPNAILHCDCVQAFGKIQFSVLDLGVDLATISAHKIHGPKGIGALWMKNKSFLKPIIFGGGQEYNLRSGTEDLPSILAFEAAVKQFNIAQNYEKVEKLKNALINDLKNNISIKLNSDIECSPYVLSIVFPNVNAETILHEAESHGLIISTGSACSSKKKGNRTLSAMGVNDNDIISSVRIGMSSDTTMEEVKEAAKILIECYKKLNNKIGVKNG